MKLIFANLGIDSDYVGEKNKNTIKRKKDKLDFGKLKTSAVQ